MEGTGGRDKLLDMVGFRIGFYSVAQSSTQPLEPPGYRNREVSPAPFEMIHFERWFHQTVAGGGFCLDGRTMVVFWCRRGLVDLQDGPVRKGLENFCSSPGTHLRH